MESFSQINRQYTMPSIHVDEGSLTVPLDWRGINPADTSAVADACDTTGVLNLFYRVLSDPSKIHDDLPLLIYLQGGPGGKGPRPLNANSDGWIGEALKHFRIVVPDQRGTGRSSQVTGNVIQNIGTSEQQADFLQRFLADSIVKDFEYLRLQAFNGKQWVSLGQSYGGFLTCTYLSNFPQGLAACFTTGGIPGIRYSIDDVYRHTYPRVIAKAHQYYDRYPADADIMAKIADRVASEDITLPNGDPLSVRRLQSLGKDFGMKPGFERLHWLIDDAFDADDNLSDGFLMRVLERTSSAGNALYWTLQEFIYANGECNPIKWSAQRILADYPQLNPNNRPLMFTGEMCYPWMFEQDSALQPFKAAVDILMERTQWGQLYDLDQLIQNEVPLQSAVYFNDMYVDRDLQIDSLSCIANSHYWVSSDFEHDGVHGPVVFKHLLDCARERGDLSNIPGL